MKIVIVHPFFLPQLFGIEKVMLGHARHLAMRGHDVHVITSAQRFPTGRFSNLPSIETHDGFTIHRVRVLLRSPSRFFYYLANSGLLLSGLASKLRELSPDVVHVHNVASAMWSYTAARYTARYRKKLFYSLHYHPDALSMSPWHTSLVHWLNRLPIRSALRLYHLTRLDFDLFSQEYPRASRDKFAVLPNGVDPSLPPTEEGHTQTGLSLLFVGRVEDYRKGFDLLESAYEKVRAEGWVLTVIGQIGDAKRISLQEKFGLAVRILGTVEESTLEQEYSRTDLFIMPARYEGFGMPYIEAMRYGTAVIGTTAGGIPETVPPGTGILVPPDDEASLAEAISRLGRSKEERDTLGAAGQRWSERFQWHHIIDRLETDYRQL